MNFNIAVIKGDGIGAWAGRRAWKLSLSVE